MSLAMVYGDGGFLDAKWEVMRRHRRSAQSFEEWLLDRLPAGGRVLDAGAGSGRFAIPLARRGFDVVVLAAHMLYHLDEIVAGVRALSARVRPGGLFVATTNAAAGMRAMFELHLATMRTLGLPVEDGPEPVRFFLQNGAELLEQVFSSVRREDYDGGYTAPSADPVFAYYAATKLYRAPMRDVSLPEEARLRIAPTFVHLTQQRIDADGPLMIGKMMGAFLATH